MVCFTCNKTGHHFRECPQRPQRGPRPTSEHDDRSHDASNPDLDGNVRLALTGTVGSSSTEFGKDVNRCAGHLSDHPTARRVQLCELFLHGVQHMSSRTLHLAAVVKVLSVTNKDLAQDILQCAREQLRSALSSGAHTCVRMIVRFAAALVAVSALEWASFLSLAEALLESARVCPHAGDSEQLVYAVAAALPWLGDLAAFLSDVTPLFESLQQHARSRPALPEHLRPLHDEERVSDALSVLTSAVSEVLETKQSSLLVHDEALLPFRAATQELDAEIRSGSPLSYDFTASWSSASSSSSSSEKLPHPAAATGSRVRTMIKIFDLDPATALPPMHAWVVSELYSDLIVSFSKIHTEGVKLIVALPNQWDILAEAVFSQLLTLPRPPVEKLVFYNTLAVDLFRADPRAIPPRFGRAMNTFWERSHQLDTDARDRLTDWLSLHLTNFNLTWPWVAWSEALQLEPTSPRRVFVTEVLRKLVRLAFWDRVQNSLPEPMRVLLESKAEITPLPSPVEPKVEDDKEEGTSSSSSSSASPLDALVLEAVKLFSEKADPVNVLNWLNSKATTVEDKAHIAVTALLHSNQKSYTHALVAMERYKNVLSSISTQPRGTLNIALTVGKVWQSSGQNVTVLLDKCLVYNFVDGPALGQLLVQYDVVNSSLPMEIIRNAVHTLHRKLAIAKSKAGSDPNALKAASAALQRQMSGLFLPLLKSLSERLTRSSSMDDESASSVNLSLSLARGRWFQILRTYASELAPLAPTLTSQLLPATDAAAATTGEGAGVLFDDAAARFWRDTFSSALSSSPGAQ